MKIAYIAAGAGGMYCGACNRDMALITGLIRQGHQVEVIPLYTPIRSDTGSMPDMAPIHYGGINVYLQQISPFFRHTPRFVDRLLDSPNLLRWVSKFAVKTRAESLGAMTVSVLSGRDGRQRKELNRLLSRLASGDRPDIVSITNSMLAAIAPEVKRRLGVPVVCSLQGEDSFIEAMADPYKSLARELMIQHAQSVDLFVSPSEGYARRMAEFLNVAPDRIRVVRTGVNLTAYRNRAPRIRDPFTIGYLSTILYGKGLDIAIDALDILVNNHKRDVRLAAAGRQLDSAFLKGILRSVADRGLQNRFSLLGELQFEDKVKFLNGLSVFCLPSRTTECRGMAAMEALAAGVPIVVPDSGTFPEMIDLTSGGIMFTPQDPASLAAGIETLMDDANMADRMGQSGAVGIEAFYSVDEMTERVLSAYFEVATGSHGVAAY